MDKTAVKALLDDIPASPEAPGQMLRRRVWEYLVQIADDDGRVRVTATQIAAALAEGRRPPPVQSVRSATAWLRKKGLLTTIEAAAGHEDPANTYQLSTTLARPDRARRPDPALQTAQAWLAADTSDEGLAEDVAHWVTGIWAVRDGGPGWVETARQVRPELDQLPADARRHYARGLITTLARRGWLRYTTDEGSLSAGPRLKHRHPVTVTPRHTSAVNDRGY
jgi:hypothetical protein